MELYCYFRRIRSKRSSSKDRDRKKRRDESRKSDDKEVKNGVKVRRDYDAEEKGECVAGWFT